MKNGEWLKYYGSSTVGERGQIALPKEIRERFKILHGDKLLVMGSSVGNFERVIIMKPDEVTGLLRSLMNIEQFMEQDGTKKLEQMLKGEIKKR
jgi:AbrB family looped-hinge helix DNA binding protein